MEAMDIVARGPAQTSLMLNLLPPELLLMIFAYFAPARNPLPDQEYWLDRSDLFAFRSTCRAFRFIANELLFWVDDDFRVVETIPRRLSSFEDDSFDATSLELILSDRHLLASLAKRKVWHFKNITTLRVVLLKVPSFRRQPVSVHLLFDKLSSGYWLRTSFNVAISELFACHCLTSLVLLDNMDDVYQNSEPHQLIDLDLIVQCCPTITLLRLICTHLVGTLRHLSTLQSLVADNINIRNPSAFLPVQSTHSLTHLSVLLDKSDFLFESACTDGTFALFVNLTTLFVHPLTDPMCDVLMGGHFRLKHFRTTAIPRFGHLNLIKIIVMFSESSLRGLQSLTMAFEDHYEWRSSHSDLALAIATNLRRLNTLVIGMGIDPAWCSHFSSLRKLQRLVWYVPEPIWHIPESACLHDPDPNAEQENEHGPRIEYVRVDLGCLESESQRRLFKAEYTEHMFAQAFSDFVQCPSVTVEVMNGWMYHHVVPDCHAVPFLYDDNLSG